MIWVATLSLQLSSHCADCTESRSLLQRHTTQLEIGLLKDSTAASTAYCGHYQLRKSDDRPITWGIFALFHAIRQGESNARRLTAEWGSGTWYPLDVALGDETEHIIAQASVTTLELCIQVNVDQLDVGVA